MRRGGAPQKTHHNIETPLEKKISSVPGSAKAPAVKNLPMLGVNKGSKR